MLDLELRYVVASRRWCTEFGFEGREYPGRRHDDLLPDVLDRWREGHRRGLAGQVVWNECDHLPDAYGRDRWARWKVHPWSIDGEVAGIVILTEDITERRHAARAIAESESRDRSLFEVNPHPMWVYDLDTLAFRAVNDAAVAHFGFSPNSSWR